nr:C40 family peptidase [uncultured Mediterraneibacter sp.]
MRLKRVHSAFIAAALTCSMAVTPVLAAPDTLEDLQNQQENLESQKESAQGELSSLQSELNTLLGKIDDLEEQLIAKGEEITQAEKDLEAAEEKRQEQYDAMKLRIKYMYEAGSGTATMEKVMSSGDITSMLTQAEYSQQVHEYDREQLQEYANTVAEIEELQDTLKTEMANLESLEVEYQEQQDDLDATIASKQDEISNLDGMIQEAAQKVQEEKDRQAAEAAERQRQQEAAAAAAEQSSGGGSSNDGNSGGGGTGGGSTGGGSSSGSSGGGSYNVATGNVVVDRAYSKLGVPYVWGAVGPNSFDCSGFVGYCLTGKYQRIWTSGSFLGWTRVSNPQPGDVCVRAGHCGIYIGGGMMIHAPQTGDVVKIAPVPSNMFYVRY